MIPLGLGVAWAQATGFAEAMQAADAAMAAGDWSAARAAVEAAWAAAPESPTLLPASEVGRIGFYRGAIEWRAGSRDRALDHWRATLAQVPAMQPDATALPDPEGQDAFYALVAEVRGFKEVPTGLPADPGEALLFIDGRRLGPEDFVFVGEHLLQARCPDRSVHGAWWTFGAPPADWLAVCSGGTWAPPVAADDRSRTPRRPEPAPEPVVTPVEPEPAPVLPTPAPPERAPTPGLGRRIAGWSLVGTGALLLGGGAVTNFLLVEPAWDDIAAANAAPGSITREQATVLEGDFHRARLLTLALLGAGTAAAGTGVALRPYQVELYLAPGGVGLVGGF